MNSLENTDMVWEDPIVKEVRAIREAIAARHHNDIRAMGRYYQRKEAQTSHKRVVLTPRQIELPQKNN